ncbi:MAG TPA: sulfurtransferase, partial [Dehalococcoidia bacterium]|nr:sulfurtransferase [Dehalococcoidia bacterium]
HPELLAEPEWLAQHIADANVRVIDCAALEAYRRAHIRGAVGLPVHFYIKDPADETHVMPADQFAQLMGRLGVGNDTTVVAYDDNNSLVAARLWWVLQYYGHVNAKVLNGGWHRWLYEGRPITTHATHPEPATFTPRPRPDVLCTLDELKARVGRPGTQILDVRSDEEWRGENDRGNKRRGHVPGAAHLEWLNFVSKDDRRIFLPAEELRAMLRSAGVEPGGEVVTYCQGGIRAAHAYFVLKLLGYNDVRNYDGSMREWANREDTPLVVD